MTVDDIRYDADAHRSFAPDGREVPHVTAIISACRVTTDFEELRKFGVDIDLARGRGTAVHADCHAYDDGDLPSDYWTTGDPRIVPYVEAWARCREDMALTPLRRERRLFNDLWFYVGIEDGVYMRQALRVLVDIKTGDPDECAADLQTAAYKAADERVYKEKIDERWAVWLLPNQRVPYRIVNYDASDRPNAWQDFPNFLACRTVYGLQQQRRRAA